MPHALLTLLFALQPFSPIIEDRVTVVERNHFYDAEAKPVFVQNIWWDEDGNVVAWRMIRREPWRLGKGDYLFVDNAGGEPRMRRVRAVSEMETYLQYDRELVQRDVLPVSERRELGVRP